MTENFFSVGKETDIQVQKAPKLPSKMRLKRSTPRHILIQTGKA